MSDDLMAGMRRLDDMLSDARRELLSVRTQPAVGDGADGEPVLGLGEAADGLVKVTVAAGGRVERIAVDARHLRQGLEVVCEDIATATNAALDDLRSKVSATAGALAVDPAALSARMQDLQNQSMQSMTQISDALSQVVARIRGQ